MLLFAIFYKLLSSFINLASQNRSWKGCFLADVQTFFCKTCLLESFSKSVVSRKTNVFAAVDRCLKTYVCKETQRFLQNMLVRKLFKSVVSSKTSVFAAVDRCSEIIFVKNIIDDTL